ncbi:MAG: threonine export protein RhtC [Leptospiraceae bacterium]|nr:MAG: threonine export protein RhtC [Leptospiraceae bacterium]
MIKLFLIGYLGVLIPGPDMLLVIRTSILYGYKDSIYTLLGILSGNIIYIFPVILGYTFLIEKYIPYLMIIGGIYIIYLSFLMLKKNQNNKTTHYNKSIKSFYLLGLFTNLSNPKAILYFASVLLPALIEKDIKIYFLMLSFFIGVILAFLMLIYFASFIQNFLQNQKYIKYINIGFFFVFFNYGIYLLYQGFKIFTSNHIFHI